MKIFKPTQTDVDNLRAAKELSKAGIENEFYSVYDRLAQTYMPPFVAQNDAVAARLVLASCQDANSMLAQSPADFELYHVGSMNVRTGVMRQEEVRWCASVAGLLQAAMSSSSGAVQA